MSRKSRIVFTKLAFLAKGASSPSRRLLMNIEMVRNALLWCTVLNYGLVVFWFLLYALPHAWLHRLWSKWFRLSVEQFDAINFAGIVLYKTGILLFNLVPYVALAIVG
jgi:hypothetical protein